MRLMVVVVMAVLMMVMVTEVKMVMVMVMGRVERADELVQVGRKKVGSRDVAAVGGCSH